MKDNMKHPSLKLLELHVRNYSRVMKSNSILEEVKSFYINLITGEDVDVRMLGDGRPFVIELVDPHRG